jgi:hypothetical protein
VTTGITAELALPAFAGSSASSFGQEADLTIDPAGDLLTIDPVGDVLVVTLSPLTFVGATAAMQAATQGALAFTGGTAAMLAADPLVALEGEGWAGFQTESGRTIETEGS